MMMQPPPIGLKSPGLNRFGGTSTSPAAPSSTSAANQADSTRWYESGPFWVMIFLFSGYILVYRTLR